MTSKSSTLSSSSVKQTLVDIGRAVFVLWCAIATGTWISLSYETKRLEENLNRQQNITQQVSRQVDSLVERDSVRAQIYRYSNEYGIPLNLSRTIIDVANDSQIPAKILFSIVRQESNFDSLAVSEDNAIGLMQVRPFVARTVQPDISANDLFNSRKNLEIGVRYLERMVERYQNIHTALQAYYVGPTNLDNGKYTNHGRNYANDVLGR